MLDDVRDLDEDAHEDDDELDTKRMLDAGAITRDSTREQTFAAVAAALNLASPARTIGRFLVLDELGSGANGTVRAAYDPQLDRKVALKTLRSLSGSGERERRLRLQREARALARLRHPAVVAVHDVGTHEGELYIAMELVVGLTLTRWREAAPRHWTEILEVLTQAARGLAAAHEAGVIHRDFKPDNVLIDEHGAARVVDFGLAGPLPTTEGPDVTAAPGAELSVTRTGAVVGTPAFLAPECFGGAPGNAASDQFSFCVALFEALYGQRPFAGETLAALAANVTTGRIRQVERGVVPLRLHRVILTGLAVHPRDRHADMNALLAALEQGRGSKRRRRILAGAAVIGLLAAGVASNAGGEHCPVPTERLERAWSEAHAARTRASFTATELGFADKTAQRAVAAIEAWTQAWTAAWTSTCDSDPSVRTRQRECLDRALVQAQTLTERWAQADTATVTAAIEAAHSLRAPADCLRPLWSASGLADAKLDEERTQKIEALRVELAHAKLLGSEGDYVGSIAELHAAIATAEPLDYPPLLAELHVALGTQLRMNKVLDEAEVELERGFFMAQRASDDPVAIDAALQLALLVSEGQGPAARGELWLEHASALVDRWPEHPSIEVQLSSVSAGMSTRVGDYTRARELFAQALDQNIALNGPRDWTTGLLWHQLGTAQINKGDHEQADASIRLAVEIFEESLGPDHPSTANAVRARAAVLLGQQDTEAALALSRDSVERTEHAFGAGHSEVASAYVNHAIALFEHGDKQLGLDFFRRALEIHEDQLGPNHALVAMSTHNLGVAYETMGRPLEAVAWHELGHERTLAALGPDHRGVADSAYKLGAVLYNVGRLDEACPHLRRAWTLAARSENNAPQEVATLAGYAACVIERGEIETARVVLDEGLGVANSYRATDPEQAARMTWLLQLNLADLALVTSAWAEAREHAERALESQAGGEDGVRMPAQYRLGGALVELEKFAAAEPVIEQTLAWYEHDGTDGMALAKLNWDLARCVDALGRDPTRARALAERAASGYEAIGRSEAAAEIHAWLDRQKNYDLP